MNKNEEQQLVKQQFGSANKKDLFAKLEKYKYADQVKNGIAQWGQYNDQPKKLLDLLDESTWHKLAIETKFRYVIGSDLLLNEETNVVANTKSQQWSDIFAKITMDYLIYGNYALEVIWNNERTDLEVYYIPMRFVRASEKDYRGDVDEWFIYPRWEKTRNVPKDDKDLKVLPTFNPALRNEQPQQLLVVSRINPSSDYYGDPDYVAALESIFTDGKITDFKKELISNAISYAGVIQVPGSYSDDDWKSLVTHLNSMKNGETPILNPSSATEQVIFGVPANLENVAKTYNTWIEDAQQRILSAHGIAFSEIAGVAQNNSGLSREQIRDKFQIFANTTIKDIRNGILRGMNRVARYQFDGNMFSVTEMDILAGLPLEGDTGILNEPQNTGNNGE